MTLTQYILYNNKLFKLEKLKIFFQYNQLIDFQPGQLLFNYIKFYTISYFFYIFQIKSMVNYNTIYNKAIYKYFFKTFYNEINKTK